MRDLLDNEIADIAGGISVINSLIGGVTSTLVSAAVDVFAEAKRGSEYTGNVQNQDPLTGALEEWFRYRSCFRHN